MVLDLQHRKFENLMILTKKFYLFLNRRIAAFEKGKCYPEIDNSSE